MSDAGKRRPNAEDIPEVLARVSEGKSLRSACGELGLDPPSTHTFIDQDPALRQHYARAKEMRAEVLAEQALTIGLAAANAKSGVKADGARVALDAIKWATARMAPKTHGERSTIDLNVVDLSGLSDEELNALEAIRNKLALPGSNPGGEGQAGS